MELSRRPLIQPPFTTFNNPVGYVYCVSTRCLKGNHGQSDAPVTKNLSAIIFKLVSFVNQLLERIAIYIMQYGKESSINDVLKEEDYFIISDRLQFKIVKVTLLLTVLIQEVNALWNVNVSSLVI